MQRYTLMLCLAPVLLAGCQGHNPEQDAAADARAVAQVEAAQNLKPPVQPIMPEPVPATARKLFRLSDRGCNFRTERQPGGDPLMVAGKSKAVLRIDGEPAILAADSGSPEVLSGVRAKYTGRQHWAQIMYEPAGGEAYLILRDRYDRVVYAAPGKLDCGESL